MGMYTLRELSISCSTHAGCDPSFIGVPTISAGKIELILSRWEARMPSLVQIYEA
jgi:hypothetical protein